VTEDSAERIELNGVAARVEDLRAIAQTNYGHFTAMRVEDGGVRGLDLHLARLDAATRGLCGAPLPADRVREYLRHAIADAAGEVSLRVTVFARGLDRDDLTRVVEPDVLVVATAARTRSLSPLRVKSFTYARDMPAIKHVGTFPLFSHRRRAQFDGFDDALFAEADGHISEGSIWNVGFFDAGGIVWPDAPQLDGVSMQLLKAGLARNGMNSTARKLRLVDLSSYRAAFFTNASVPVRPIASIDTHHFEVGPEIFDTLRSCYESNIPQLI
jgi:branched-subunit amino acid aminotransferase/4-amino-4-deoxychorismate lyase